MALSDRFDRVSGMIEELMEREERYKVFLDANPWGTLVVDQTFHIVFMNKTMELMSGYSLDDIQGRHLHYIMPKADHKNDMKCLIDN